MLFFSVKCSLSFDIISVQTLTLYLFLPRPTDDLWRVPFSLPKTHPIQVLFWQLCCLCLQSCGHLPLWCCNEPVSDRHSQIFYWPTQATLPGYLPAWLETHQLYIRGVYWKLQLHWRPNQGQRGQVGILTQKTSFTADRKEWIKRSATNNWQKINLKWKMNQY